MNIYEENGYKNRGEYISCIAEDYGIDVKIVKNIAGSLDPSEDFDYLVTLLEDYTE